MAEDGDPWVIHTPSPGPHALKVVWKTNPPNGAAAAAAAVWTKINPFGASKPLRCGGKGSRGWAAGTNPACPRNTPAPGTRAPHDAGGGMAIVGARCIHCRHLGHQGLCAKPAGRTHVGDLHPDPRTGPCPHLLPDPPARPPARLLTVQFGVSIRKSQPEMHTVQQGNLHLLGARRDDNRLGLGLHRGQRPPPTVLSTLPVPG